MSNDKERQADLDHIDALCAQAIGWRLDKKFTATVSAWVDPDLDHVNALCAQAMGRRLEKEFTTTISAWVDTNGCFMGWPAAFSPTRNHSHALKVADAVLKTYDVEVNPKRAAVYRGQSKKPLAEATGPNRIAEAIARAVAITLKGARK
jgi:hypothetical protein